MKIKATISNKIQFCFVEFDEKTRKVINCINVYLNISEAIFLSHAILSGRIYDPKYSADIFPLENQTEEKTKFSIVPDKCWSFVFIAESCSNCTNKISEQADSNTIIRVSCDNENMKKVALILSCF
jgi:hypothetical protein